MANKNFENYAVAGNNVALTYDNVNDTVTFDVNVDKTDVGLGNVDNTSDINKPISTLVQNALNLKEGVITAGTTSQYWRGDKTFQTLDKTAVGLSNVDNTSDANKPISTATQTALNGKQATISLTTTGSSGASTFASNVLNIPTYSLSGLGGQPLATNLTSISALTFDSTSFVKMSAAGTFALDTNTYLTAETDTLASVTGRGATTTTAIGTGAITANGNILVTAQNGRYVGFDAFSSGMSVDFRFGDVNNRVANTFGSNLNILSYHGVQISNNSGAGVIGAALKVIGNNSSKPILELANATTIFCTVFNGGNILLQNGGTFTDSGFRLDVNGTARIQNQLTTTGSITAASAIARGVYMNNTLVAAANGDVLTALEINPTFTNGAFTGVGNNWINLIGNAAINGTNQIYIRRNNADVFFASSAETLVKSISTGSPLRFFIGATKVGEFSLTTGNFILQNGGTFTDAGFRLDVVGADSRFNGIRAGLGAGQVASNTVFGNGALGSNSTGTGVTAIGYQALRLSTGINNTAVGYQSGARVTTGTNNTLLGYLAGFNITTGALNVVIGSGLTTGGTITNSVGIGADLTCTGSSNTAIGYIASTAGFSGSVILGRAATATANNQFVVGSSTVNAGAVITATSPTINEYWTVIINGVSKKIALIS